MARKGSDLPGNIVDVVARMPWWTGVALALVSYLALHQIAAMEITVPAGAVATAALSGLLRGMAMSLQYVFPMVFFAGAAVSVWSRYRERKNYADVAAERGQDALEMLSWREFENLVGEFFRRKGFSVEQRGGRAPDGGVDLMASIGEDRYLVQCKHWRVQRVGVAVVREICGVAAAEGAAGVFVVTSGSFTDEARRFVEKNRIDIELITGDRLRQMIRGLETELRAT